MEQPLAGVRVLEIGGGISAGYCAHLLGGYGADVARVEGTPTVALREEELVYLVAGKRRIVPRDDAELRRLALAADILVEDGPPGALAARGLDPVALRAERPELIVVSITPYGQTGPYRDRPATNGISYGAGGIMSLTGDPAREPLVTGGSQALYVGGLNAFGAASTAHLGSLLHGEGDWIDISVQECLAGMLELYGPAAAYGLAPTLRFGNYHRAVWAVYPCADGYAGVFCLERQVPALFRVLDDPALDDPRFRDPLQRALNDEELSAHVIGLMVDHTGDELLQIARRNKIPMGKVRTPLELLDDPALRERAFFDAVDLPDGRRAEVPGRPFLGLPWSHDGRLHEPGEDSATVRTEWLTGAGAAR